MKKSHKKKSLAPVIIIVTLVTCVSIFIFICCIQWILSATEENVMESFENFSEQTSLWFEDTIKNNQTVMYQLKSALISKEDLTEENVTPILQSYRDNWGAVDVGLLYEDKTAVNANGGNVEIEEWVDPIEIEGYAYGVRIVLRKMQGKNVLSFNVSCKTTVEDKKCIGLYMDFSPSIIDSMMENSTYANEDNAYIAVIDRDGNIIWKSDVEDNNVKNMYEELEKVEFDDRGKLDKVKQRLELNYSGSTIYYLNGEKRAMAYVPLETNYWRIVIGVPYNAIIDQNSSNVVVLILVSAALIIVSMFITFYFILRQRKAEISQQEVEIKATNAISEARSRSDFMSRMSHELRTPLNGIVGMVELAIRYGDNKKKRNEYLEKIKASSDFLMSLINDVLDMSKIEHNKIVLFRDPFDIKEMCKSISDIFYPMITEKKLTFELNYDSLKYQYYIGDEVRLKQVVTNLLSNAFKFTDKGGIKCTFSEIEEEGKNTIIIKVEDTGRGISQEYIKRIFMPFEQEYSSFTRNKKGTGLGLAICSSLVKMANGTITVDSTLGKGSIFTVTLPLDPVSDDFQMVEEESLEEDCLQGIKILLAEDNEINAQIATALLMDFGAEVTHVSDGSLALQAFESSSPGDYDIILMDIMMPEMDGMEATKKIRASDHLDGKTIPIIAVTANALAEDSEAMLASGMNDHLFKPYNIEKICRVILKYCHKY